MNIIETCEKYIKKKGWSILKMEFSHVSGTETKTEVLVTAYAKPSGDRMPDIFHTHEDTIMGLCPITNQEISLEIVFLRTGSNTITQVGTENIESVSKHLVIEWHGTVKGETE